MKYLTIIVVWLSALVCPIAAQESQSAGEKVAVQYMKAFFRGDIDSASQLLGSSVLDPFKAALVSKIESASSQEQKEFITTVGYSSLEAFRNAPPRELFVKLMKLERANVSPEMTEKAKAVVVEVEKVEKLDGGKQRISMRVEISGALSDTATAVVESINGRWLVVGI